MTFKEFLFYANKQGLPVPFAFDSAKGKPSITLFFTWVANMLAVVSLISLHFLTDVVIASALTCVYGIVWTVLYMMRSVHKAKFDIDSRSFELESGNDEKN